MQQYILQRFSCKKIYSSRYFTQQEILYFSTYKLTSSSENLLRTAIKNFHANSSQERKRGTWVWRDLGNMDQTLLSFAMDDKRTYEKTSVDKFWIASGRSGLEKRQCTVQLIIFVEGSTLPPLLIFLDKGLQINLTERKQ